MGPTKQTLDTIEQIRADHPDMIPNVEIVGAWIWARFEDKPSEEIRAYLKESGFRWNRKRQVWQNPCGVKSKASPGDPRAKYGAYRIKRKDEQAAA